MHTGTDYVIQLQIWHTVYGCWTVPATGVPDICHHMVNIVKWSRIAWVEAPKLLC